MVEKSAELSRLAQDRAGKPIQLESHGERVQEEQIMVEQALSWPLPYGNRPIPHGNLPPGSDHEAGLCRNLRRHHHGPSPLPARGLFLVGNLKFAWWEVIEDNC